MNLKTVIQLGGTYGVINANGGRQSEDQMWSSFVRYHIMVNDGIDYITMVGSMSTLQIARLAFIWTSEGKRLEDFVVSH